MSEICRCSHPKEFHQSFLKEVPCDYDGKCVGGCQKFEPVGSDRHPKWQRVEPGTVIPAGQPYRVEYASIGQGLPSADERISAITHAHKPLDSETWFIDSSWKPPLVLPTEPTWGIVIFGDQGGDTYLSYVREYVRSGSGLLGTSFNRNESQEFDDSRILDFIPLTDEQVARIEAAR